MKKIDSVRIKKSDSDLQIWMKNHYSKPKGFVGRQLFYKIYVDDVCYGAIAAGSCTLHLPKRLEFFGREIPLNNLVNNTFFHIEKKENKYPYRNFSSKVVEKFRTIVSYDWFENYNSYVEGFETLVELPRTGELYLKDGWTEVGITKGFTCKRIGGKGSDDWGGKRVWDKENLRPKRIFYRKNDIKIETIDLGEMI